MALTIRLLGIIRDVLPIDRYDEQDPTKRRQHIILDVPQWTDPLQIKRGKTECWKITVLNGYIDKNNVSTALIGKEVEVECFISSKEVQRNGQGPKIYPISTRLKRIVLVQKWKDPARDGDLIKRVPYKG